MSNPPCIKGTVFTLVVEELLSLLVGRVAEGGLKRWLNPEDLAFATERPLASGWYPFDVYGRMNLLLRDVAGGGRDEYLVEQGMKTARRFLEEGHYQQIRYAIRSSLGASATKRSAFEPSATI